jgi:hypothetical protein
MLVEFDGDEGFGDSVQCHNVWVPVASGVSVLSGCSAVGNKSSGRDNVHAL